MGKTSKCATDRGDTSPEPPTLDTARSLQTPIAGARGPQPGLPEYRPPRNLAEALEAARDRASAEVRYVLASGLPISDLIQRVDDGSAHCAAEMGALALLDCFTPAEDEAVWDVAKDLAEDAVYQRRKELALLSPAELVDPPTPGALAALQTHALPTIGPTRHPSRPLRPLDEAIAVAFWDACAEYHDDFPEGVPFEELPTEVYDLFVQRGRHASFWVLEPCLPWSAAVKMAEAIGEAAWQYRARELACPRAAITASVN
jgi:hypothetical protein